MQGELPMEKRFSELVEFTRQMGLYAIEKQRGITRTTKADGSYVTATDLFINESMINKIGELYPEANIITEENKDTPFDPKAPLTFIIDPIDGTTAYSRGMQNWAVSVGIVDDKRKAVGAIVYLPRFGKIEDYSLFVREINSPVVYLNGEPYQISLEGKNVVKDIIVNDRTWRNLEFPVNQIKFRSLCSSVINMLCPVLFPDFAAAINDEGSYCWDVAGTAAILDAYGIKTIMSTGDENLFTDTYLEQRKPYPVPVYAATPKALEFMFKNFRLK